MFSFVGLLFSPSFVLAALDHGQKRSHRICPPWPPRCINAPPASRSFLILLLFLLRSLRPFSLASCIAGPLGIECTSISVEETDDHATIRATVSIKVLAKRFTKGINRFEVAFHDGERTAQEIVLDIQF